MNGRGCGTPTVDEEAEYEARRDARIESYYQESAWYLAERIVDLEDELGSDVNGICTGMHADVVEACAEVERLRAVLAELDSRLTWHTTCKTCARILDAAYEETCRAETAEAARDEYKRLHAHASDLYEMFRRKYDDEVDRSERYRLAWLSARRRAAREADYAAEAVRRGLV